MELELADLVSDLRAEMEHVIHAGAGKDLRFRIDQVEIDVTVSVEKSADAGAKAKFLVVEVGADGKLTSSRGQHIKVTLHPEVRENSPLDTATDSLDTSDSPPAPDDETRRLSPAEIIKQIASAGHGNGNGNGNGNGHTKTAARKTRSHDKWPQPYCEPAVRDAPPL